MRALVLLLILLLVLPVSAISMDQAGATGMVKANTTTKPVITIAPQQMVTARVTTAPEGTTSPELRRTIVVVMTAVQGIPYKTIIPVTTTPSIQRPVVTGIQRGPTPPPPGMSALNVLSDPPGANANIDNTWSVTTNGTITVPAGNHNLLITKAGYFPYAAPISLADGTTTNFSAVLSTVSPLEPTIPSSVARLTIDIWPPGGYARIGNLNSSTPVTVDLQPGTWNYSVSKPGYLGKAQMTPYLAGGTWLTLFIDLEPVGEGPSGNAMCLSGQQCLTPAEAAAYWPGQWWYKETPVCDHVIENSQSVPRYCTQGVSGGQGFTAGKVPVAVPVITGQAGQIVRQNVSFVPSVIPSVMPEGQAPARQGGVIESIASFFSGLFGR